MSKGFVPISSERMRLHTELPGCNLLAISLVNMMMVGKYVDLTSKYLDQATNDSETLLIVESET